MTRRRTNRSEIATSLARMTSWRGLQPHDEMRVRGRPGQQSRYEFLAFVQNTVTGECFVEALGGRRGRDGADQRNIRMFPPERCSPPPKRRRRRTPPDPSIEQLRFDDLGSANRHGSS